MSIRIEVKNPSVTEISGTSKAGRPYTIRKQPAWAYTFDEKGKPNEYPERIDINLADGQDAFQPGNYTLSPQCFYVGDFHTLQVGRLILEPIKARA